MSHFNYFYFYNKNIHNNKCIFIHKINILYQFICIICNEELQIYKFFDKTKGAFQLVHRIWTPFVFSKKYESLKVKKKKQNKKQCTKFLFWWANLKSIIQCCHMLIFLKYCFNQNFKRCQHFCQHWYQLLFISMKLCSNLVFIIHDNHIKLIKNMICFCLSYLLKQNYSFTSVTN